MLYTLSSTLCFSLSPSQRRLIRAAVRAGVVGIIVRRAGAPQRGLVGILLVIQPALVLDARQSRLHAIELAGSHQVVRARRQNCRNLRLYVGNAVRSRRVVAERPRERARLVLLQRRQLFED